MIKRLLNNHFHGLGGINELFAIALPLFISSSCETFMLFTDRLFLSKLAPEYMTASFGGGLTAFMFFTFFLGLIGYANALVAQYLGAGTINKCPIVLTQSLIISFVGYPIMLLCLPLGFLLFERLGVPLEQLAPQKIYFKIIMYGSLLSFIRQSMSSYFSGIGRTRIIMVASIITMIVNIIGNYIFIFGNFGVPPMGIAGAAIGTLLGNIVGLLIYFYLYFENKNRSQFHVLKSFHFDKKVMKKLFVFGYPAGLELFFSLIAFNFFIMTFHSYGLAVSSAITITFNWEMVSFIPLLGINTAITSLVGRYIGANDYNIANRITKSGLKIVCFYSIFTILLFSIFAKELVEVFHPKENDAVFLESMDLAVFMLRMVTLYIFADALGIVYSGALRGAGDTFVPMCLCVIAHWLLFAITFVFIRFYNVTPETAWIIAIILIWNLNLTFYFRYKTGKWRYFNVIDK